MTMDTDEDDATIVRSTIDLGRNLGLEVVAEGVENQAMLERLRELGCTLAQGYYLTRPVPPAELEDWLQRWHGAPEYPGHLWTGKASSAATSPPAAAATTRRPSTRTCGASPTSSRRCATARGSSGRAAAVRRARPSRCG